MRKIKFSERKFQNLLKKGDIKFILDRVEEQSEAEARRKELEIIYPSLVGIAKNQQRIEINVPNGVWSFKSDIK